jgi:drug/metabolite transporter (DMT)-like permease
MKNNKFAILYMLTHALAGASLYATMKIITQTIDSNLAVFLYKTILLFGLMPWFFINGGIKNLVTKKFNIYLLGAVFSTSATLCLMFGIKNVPIANATLIGYLEKILLILVGIYYYKEKITLKMLSAIILAIISAIIIVIPKLNQQFYFNQSYLFIFLSVFLWVAYCLVIKYLGTQDSLKCQTFYNTLLSSLFAMLSLWLFNDKNIPFFPLQEIKTILPLLVITSILYMVVLLSLIKSIRTGDLAIITPFGYTKSVFAAILGYLIFGDVPSNIQILAFFLISFSSCYLILQVNKK